LVPPPWVGRLPTIVGVLVLDPALIVDGWPQDGCSPGAGYRFRPGRVEVSSGARR
jgi:hypothetical protein